MKRSNAVIAAIVGLASVPMSAKSQTAGLHDPFVFATSLSGDGTSISTNEAWWLRFMVIRPMGTSVSGVSLASINQQRPGAAPSEWCFADVLTPKSFTSNLRDVQMEIDRSMADSESANFAVSGAFTGGETLDAVVGNYETCHGQQGAFLLVTDRSPTPKIVYFNEWENWKGLIWLRQEGDVLHVGSCFECGHAESLFYDPRRSRFYWENTGD